MGETFASQALDTIAFVNVKLDGVICRHRTNFTSELARSLYQMLGIKKLFCAAYHPQTQGLVECVNDGLGRLPPKFVYRPPFHEALRDTPFFCLYGRDPKTTKNCKSNEVTNYRRQLYKSLHNSRRMVERQLIKAQDQHALRLQDQKAVSYEESDSVWAFQHFRAKRGEKKTKQLAFSWHGLYQVLGQIGENAYRIAISRHPDKVVTVNVNRLKMVKGRWSRPYNAEAPVTTANDESEGDGVSGAPPVEYDDPLSEEDLPADSYLKRVVIGSDETASW
ncbi:hypothetical protein PHMEG_00012696 [Phytophthora megakarya]|uniref:Integrase catalytic domain-containing protein n=1 Tax=Phytophthora megakarya TaxID=4795 RepID=A0A225W932_9STRA|nr:hypothetical protein PHMEG_00012696 [Phytophthora megakarya]